MKRILMVLTVALVMVAMIVVMVAPAFARSGHPPNVGHFNGASSVFAHNEQPCTNGGGGSHCKP